MELVESCMKVRPWSQPTGGDLNTSILQHCPIGIALQEHWLSVHLVFEMLGNVEYDSIPLVLTTLDKASSRYTNMSLTCFNIER